jgi:hypothetical protein
MMKSIGRTLRNIKHTALQKLQIWAILALSKIRFWKQHDLLSADDIATLKSRFTKDYYIICTRRENYLTTFFIAFGNFMLTGKWGFYSHVLMNLEDEVKTDDDFRFIEATGEGVHYSEFEHVFGEVDAVALISPKHMSIEEWTAALDRAKTYLGVPYDNLFDMKNALEINCAELVRLALQATPDYDTKFAAFEALLARKKKLTPDMFANCPDFEVVWLVKSA